MGTRSRIGYQLPTGNIVSVYHHWDGYPQWLGKKLTTNYTTDKEITELIDGGDMSSIESDRDWNRNIAPTHVQYYSQRGDSECEPLLHKNQRAFIKTTVDCWGEYSYLYRNGRWFCYDEKGKSVSLKNL